MSAVWSAKSRRNKTGQCLVADNKGSCSQSVWCQKLSISIFIFFFFSFEIVKSLATWRRRRRRPSNWIVVMTLIKLLLALLLNQLRLCELSLRRRTLLANRAGRRHLLARAWDRERNWQRSSSSTHWNSFYHGSSFNHSLVTIMIT